MSAIVNADYAQGSDSIYRYRTRVRCIVYSHNAPQPIDITGSVINFNTAKAIKSTGHLALALKANQNWLNQLNPNDYINLYVDRGDGMGWTRLFFGFIDNIQQKITTADNGTPSTIYTLACSDFQKALEKTQIYFNASLALRADFQNADISAASPSVFMTNAGISVQASPADFVVTLLNILFGFGTQFTLPSCYNPNVISANRAARAEFLLGMLSADTRNRVLTTGYRAYLEDLRARTGRHSSLEDLTDLTRPTASDIQQRERAAFSADVVRDLTGTSDSARGLFVYSALNTTLTTQPPSLLDIMDVSTYFERKAMDGYFVGQPWEDHPDVLSYLRSVANEIVNELFFDLRLVSSGGGLVDGDYFSRDSDDIGGNVVTDTATPVSPGHQYVPALIMREYPFGTISEINGEQVNLDFSDQLNTVDAVQNARITPLGRVPVGALFSDQPNLAGRHVITIPNINAADLAEGQATSRASKHLDVAVVYASEIVNSELSRSDSDLFNLLMITTDYTTQEGATLWLLAALPFLTPISIARHGLRTRVLQTRAAMAVPNIVNHIQPQTQEQDQPQQPEAPEPAQPSGTPRFPIDLEPASDGHYTQGHVVSPYGYRFRPGRPHTSAFNGQHNAVPPNTPIWRMHSGIDLRANTGVPVYAVRDGWVMAAALAENINTTPGADRYGRGSGGSDGTGAVPPFGGYGSTVIIYHPDDMSQPPGDSVPIGSVFTVYAHLLDIDSNLLQGSSTRGTTRFAPALCAGGRYQPRRVTAGDVVGHVGRTGMQDIQDGSGPNAGAHLHFEVLVKQAHRADGHAYIWPSKDQTANPDMLTAESQRVGPLASGTVFVGHPPTPPYSTANVTSQEPSAYLAHWTGAHLPGGVDPGELDADSAYAGDADEYNPPPDAAPAPSQEVDQQDEQITDPDGQQGFVSPDHIRYWLVRWALLNDHWYQHNIEYIAGSIEMRGAPEIRVGYRLDVVEWNMSFYVENVSHTWQYGEKMTTQLQVSRGQPNNPYPAYVLPSSPAFSPTNTQRVTNSRLSKFFTVTDPVAVRRAVNIETTNRHISYVNPVRGAIVNTVDSPEGAADLAAKYNENIIEAQSISADPTVESSTETSGALATSLTDPSTQSTTPGPALEDTEFVPGLGVF